MTDDEALLQVAPELTTVAPDRRGFFLDQMRTQVRAGLGQYGLALATAHELTLSARAGAPGASGAIVSESEGQLSRTYANASPGDPYWNSTTYGQRYLDQVRRNTLGVRNRMVG